MSLVAVVMFVWTVENYQMYLLNLGRLIKIYCYPIILSPINCLTNLIKEMKNFDHSKGRLASCSPFFTFFLLFLFTGISPHLMKWHLGELDLDPLLLYPSALVLKTQATISG